MFSSFLKAYIAYLNRMSDFIFNLFYSVLVFLHHFNCNNFHMKVSSYVWYCNQNNKNTDASYYNSRNNDYLISEHQSACILIYISLYISFYTNLFFFSYYRYRFISIDTNINYHTQTYTCMQILIYICIFIYLYVYILCWVINNFRYNYLFQMF